MQHAARILLLTMLIAGTGALGACARQISPDVHEGRTAGEVLPTYAGTIESVRVVQIQEYDTLEGNRTGRFVGGLGGGIAGARFGQGWGKALAVVGGSIAGMFIGAAVEQEVKRQPALEYVVRLDSGELLTIVQGVGPRLSVGQRVYVQDGQRGRGRVIPVG